MGSVGNYWRQLAVLLTIALLVSSTTVTFYVDQEIEQPLDYVEVNAVVKTRGESLDAAIQQAAAVLKDIDTLVQSYCKSYTPK